MRKYFVVVLLTVASCGFAQTGNQAMMDSLNKLLTTTQKAPTLARAITLNRLGRAYLNSSDYTHSTQLFSECLAIADKLNNQELTATCYKNLGVVEFHQHNYDKAEAYDSSAMSIYEKRNDLPGKASILNGLGDEYLVLGDSAKAAKYYNAALPLFQELGDKAGEASVYNNQSILFNTAYQQKIELGLKAKSLWDQLKVSNELPIVNTGNIGVAYLDLVRYDTLHRTPPSALIPASRKEKIALAEKYLRQAIEMSRVNNDVENGSYYTGVLAELDEQKGDFESAYHNFRKYQDVTDSIFSQKNKNQIAGLESQRTIDLKNQEIANRELQISNQHKKMWLLAVCMAFLAAIGAFIYRQSRIRKRTNTVLIRLNNELDEANKVKAKFFGILSHDLRSPLANLLNFMTLQRRKPGALSGQEIADREDQIAGVARSLLETMDAMLLWSKGQMEYFRPTITEVPVKDLFIHLRKMFAGVENIAFRFSGEEGLAAETDKHYLQVVMQNLTANAVKALQGMPGGADGGLRKGPDGDMRSGSDAEICWKAWKEPGNTFLSVSDNGPGTTDEQLRALYDETASSGTDHGLGLHIIRDLAKAIGVGVTFQAKMKSATTFVLSIPDRK